MADLLDQPGIRVRRAPLEPLHVLHCDPDDAEALGAELGVTLPTAPLRAGDGAGPRALHLAPDEWLLVGWRGEAPLTRPHALVEVSSRSLTLEIEGEHAVALLSAGCPLDLELMPVGAATRTLLGAVQVTLERQRHCFRMQYWRSFDSYVTGFLQAAASDLPAPVAS